MRRADHDNSKGSRLGPAVVAILIALPILYVLSTGPVIWYCQQRPSETLYMVVDFVYYPLFWLRGQNTTFTEVSDWYLNLFLEDIPLRRC